MIATHNIQSVFFEENIICLNIDGKSVRLPLNKVSKKLEAATEMQRSLYSISPSGYGIHWSLID